MPVLRSLIAALLLPGAAYAAPSANPDSTPPPHLEFVRPLLEETLARQDAELKKPNPAPTTRNLSNGALAALILGGDQASATAETYLRRLFSLQNNDPASPDYGSVPWQEGHPEIKDANAIEFSAQPLGPIWMGYGDRLSPEFKKEAAPHLLAFLNALRHRQMRTPSYTNIYLMRAVDLILIGEAAGDTSAANYGYDELDRWIAYTRANGIHEFDSPTYTAVDLNSLGLGYRYARRPGARATFGAILDLFWADVCANYFPGRGSLSGPHSRDYDFISGTGGLAFYYRAAGITDDGKPDMIDFERLYPYLNALPGGYRPSQGIQALTRDPQRMIISRWDTSPIAIRTNYVTPDFAIGAATGDYGPQDKMLTVELPSPTLARFPVITITPSENDDPYGAKKAPDRSGHSKPHHPPLGLAAVQEQGTALGLLSIALPADAGSQDFTISILIPSAADDIHIGDTSATTAAHSATTFTLPASLGDTLSVRSAQGAVALRLFLLDGDDAVALKGATVQFVGDAAGRKRNTLRLVVRPARGDAFPGGRCRLGVLLQCAHCADDASYQQLRDRVAHAALNQEGMGDAYTVTAHISPALTLSLKRERAGKERLLARTVNGAEQSASSALLVNGVDYGARLPAVMASH